MYALAEMAQALREATPVQASNQEVYGVCRWCSQRLLFGQACGDEHQRLIEDYPSLVR